MKSLRLVQFSAVLIFFFCLALPAMTQEKGAEETYTIKQGDTLWDISSKFLKNPFLWPKLWQRNPYITNPHWIYPGNRVRLSPFEEVKKGEPAKVVAEEKPKGAAPATPEPEIKREEPPSIEKKPEVVPEIKRVEERPFYTENRSAGFFSDVDYRGMGLILESKEGKSFMAEGDILYLVFRTSEPVLIGNKYTVFRPSEVLRHPGSEERLGRKYNITGNIQVIDRFGKFFTARVIEAFEAIEKGDMVQPYQKERMERPK